MQDVPGDLKRKGLELQCYLEPDRPARLDKRYAVRVNCETFLFGDSAARQRFREDIVAFCGILTDPVTKHRFRPRRSSPRLVRERVTYLFESSASMAAFAACPEDYALPGYTL